MIRIYWVGEDRSASERFGRELILATMREVYAEPLSVTEAGRRGLNSSAFFSAMAPLLARALAHLDRTSLTAHSPEDRRLMPLTLAFQCAGRARPRRSPPRHQPPPPADHNRASGRGCRCNSPSTRSMKP